MAQVFLHYVDQDGPHAGEKFDRRPALAHAVRLAPAGKIRNIPTYFPRTR